MLFQAVQPGASGPHGSAAPDNHELRHLLSHIKEECKEQPKLENAGSLVSLCLDSDKYHVPDLVTNMSNRAATLQYRRRDETVL